MVQLPEIDQQTFIADAISQAYHGIFSVTNQGTGSKGGRTASLTGSRSRNGTGTHSTNFTIQSAAGT